MKQADMKIDSNKMPNEPMEKIPVPSGLLACLLLIPLRAQETRQKQAGIPHRGRLPNFDSSTP